LLARACERSGRPEMTISPAAMQVLITYHWPGNVRELRNAMEWVMAAAPDDTVLPQDLPEKLGGAAGEPAVPVPADPPELAADAKAAFRPINEEIRELERRRMAEALAASGGVKTRAAQLIDMPIRTFTLKLKQYKL
jgi:DNA-binding NtrC family response regulator